MARRKGVPREEQHDWQPGAADMVQCSKCGHLTSAAEARRGVGPCPGKPDIPDPVPDSPGVLVPEGAQGVYQDDRLIGYLAAGSNLITYLEGEQPPVIAGGGPRKVESICDTCGNTRPNCGNDPARVQRAVNDDILECSDYRLGEGAPSPPARMPHPEAWRTGDEEIRTEPPEADPIVHPGPNYIEPEEVCNVCHGRLAIIPLSPRLSMVACPNRGCDLWRERLRWYPRQDRNPRRRRASRAEG